MSVRPSRGKCSPRLLTWAGRLVVWSLQPWFTLCVWATQLVLWFFACYRLENGEVVAGGWVFVCRSGLEDIYGVFNVLVALVISVVCAIVALNQYRIRRE